MYGSDEQPGMIFITTIVSPESLAQAEQLIEQEIDSATDNFTESDLTLAKNALINGLVNNAASNQDVALSFLFLRRYKLGDDYFDTRADFLSSISIEQVKKTVRSLFSTDKLIKIRIGRL